MYMKINILSSCLMNSILGQHRSKLQTPLEDSETNGSSNTRLERKRFHLGAQDNQKAKYKPPPINMPQPRLSSSDYYEILGCPRDANENALKKAYRKLAVKVSDILHDFLANLSVLAQTDLSLLLLSGIQTRILTMRRPSPIFRKYRRLMLCCQIRRSENYMINMEKMEWMPKSRACHPAEQDLVSRAADEGVA